MTLDPFATLFLLALIGIVATLAVAVIHDAFNPEEE
jgi:hypothetical protein